MLGWPLPPNCTGQAGVVDASDFLLDFMRSYQDLTFSIKIKDGIPRDNQMDKKENVWQVEENLVTFYWIL